MAHPYSFLQSKYLGPPNFVSKGLHLNRIPPLKKCRQISGVKSGFVVSGWPFRLKKLCLKSNIIDVLLDCSSSELVKPLSENVIFIRNYIEAIMKPLFLLKYYFSAAHVLTVTASFASTAWTCAVSASGSTPMISDSRSSTKSRWISACFSLTKASNT